MLNMALAHALRTHEHAASGHQVGTRASLRTQDAAAGSSFRLAEIDLVHELYVAVGVQRREDRVKV